MSAIKLTREERRSPKHSRVVLRRLVSWFLDRWKTGNFTQQIYGDFLWWRIRRGVIRQFLKCHHREIILRWRWKRDQTPEGTRMRDEYDRLVMQLMLIDIANNTHPGAQKANPANDQAEAGGGK